MFHPNCKDYVNLYYGTRKKCRVFCVRVVKNVKFTLQPFFGCQSQQFFLPIIIEKRKNDSCFIFQQVCVQIGDWQK